jgi:hypothetical protein
MRKSKKFEEANGKIENNIETSVGSSQKPKSVIEQINQMKAEGNVSGPEFTAKMRELEVILGVSEISPFGTNELEIFEENIKESSYSDLQKLANKIGINPYFEHPILKKNIIREFQAYTRNSRRNIMPTSVNSFVLDMNNPKHKELSRILNDI